MSEILLPYPEGCVEGVLHRRVKRFTIEFFLDGKLLCAHTNNSGSMLGLTRPGIPLWLSPSTGVNRKTAYTLEMTGLPEFNGGTTWVGVNTLTPNRLLRAAFQAGLLPWAEGYDCFKPEAVRGESRIDALLTGPGKPPLWVECKNVTMVEDDIAAFPDAATIRGQKHLRELAGIVAAGDRAAFFYCVQRPDGHCFAPADYIDPAYAALFGETLKSGVEVYPYRVIADKRGTGLGSLLPLAPLA